MENNIPNSESKDTIQELVVLYHSASDEKERDSLKSKIVTQMVPVVQKIARTIARRADDPLEDLVQAGFIGLLKALEKFSYNKNDNFRVFSGYYIIGEMKHYLRDKLSSIRVPRHIQELAIRIHNFTQTLTPEELTLLTSEEVAFALNTTPASVDLALQIDRRRYPVYLEDVFSAPDSLGYEELISDNNDKNRPDYEDAKIIIKDVMLKLPTQERMVVDMYYKRDMNKKEIAQTLKVSQMCVTRRIKQAFDTMSALILDDIENEAIKRGNLRKEES